ncbi:hypothetical protein GCM10010413_41130 [Promicromonospora sukumoe]|uniref:Excreted virulence factor EspC (Type VII ESX diderm) n=1 Tax=Promicromonospora sukumoe TaxID=88382 RepID=A0A7W3JE56_9MICO|nr:hypothetical protein [Promicromonospora sukumoe]MBA8811179.1 hypothetical protein [Promicromonospora sukumoe]
MTGDNCSGAGAPLPAPTGRAEALGNAATYMSEAVTALNGAARTLDRAGVFGTAEQVRGMHEQAETLHTEISLAASTAHRAERPEFYDESGTWVGRRGKGKS